MIFVEATQQNAIHLHRVEAGALRRSNARQHAVISVRHARDARKALGIDRIHADADAIEARIFERLRDLGEEVAVGGERNFRLLALESAQLGQIAHEFDDALAQQRLAAGEADFGDAKSDEHARHAQVVVERQFGEGGAIGTSAAVHAAIVTAVGDRDPQIVNGTAEFVGKRHVANFLRLRAGGRLQVSRVYLDSES